MAYAGLNTQGFNVSVMPSVQLANPTLFNNLSPLSQGLASGVQTGIQLEQAALARQQAAREIALQPLRNALLTAQVQKAQQQAAVPDIVWNDVTLQDTTNPYEQSAFDENGIRTGPAALGNVVRTRTGVAIGPGGTMTPVRQSEVIKLGSERSEEADKIAALERQRIEAARLAQQKAGDAAKAADDLSKLRVAQAQKALAEAAKLANNPDLTQRTITRSGRKVYQYFRKSAPTEVVGEVDAGPASQSLFAPGATINLGQGGAAPAANLAQPGSLEAAFGAGTPAATPAAVTPATTTTTGRAVPTPAAPVNFNLDFSARETPAAAPASEDVPDEALQAAGIDRRDYEAYLWAQANPDDPRVANVMNILTGKYPQFFQ